MQSLNRGESPIITVRAPSTLVSRVDERRRNLGLTRSQFMRRALAVALGDRCCVAAKFNDPFSDNGCSCSDRKGGRK